MRNRMRVKSEFNSESVKTCNILFYIIFFQFFSTIKRILKLKKLKLKENQSNLQWNATHLPNVLAWNCKKPPWVDWSSSRSKSHQKRGLKNTHNTFQRKENKDKHKTKGSLQSNETGRQRRFYVRKSIHRCTTKDRLWDNHKFTPYARACFRNVGWQFKTWDESIRCWLRVRVSMCMYGTYGWWKR